MVPIPVVLWFLPLHLEPKAQHAIAISLFMILAWATEVMDHGLTGLIGCYLFWALGVVKFEVAFSGFADDTPWFLMGAILFGTMASKSGLAKRLAYLVTIRIGTSYSRLLLALILSDFLLTFLVPSGMARVTIMAAVASGLIGAFGLGPGSNVGRGMFLILTYTAGVFDKSIIAGAAAITGRGIIESVGHVQVLWSQWLLAYLPSDIITILVAWRLTLWLYPPEIASLPGGIQYLKDELRKAGPWTPLEKKSLALMLMAIVFWSTDFIHHIPSSMIGLGIGLLAVLPFLRILGIEDIKKLNFLQLFFVAAAIGMGKVLSASNGLAVLTNVFFARLEPLLTHPLLSLLPCTGRASCTTCFGQRNFHVGDVHAAAHAVRDDAWLEPAQAWNAVGVFFGREDLRVSIRSPRDRVRLRLLPRQGHSAARFHHEPGRLAAAAPGSAVLLAPDWDQVALLFKQAGNQEREQALPPTFLHSFFQPRAR